MEYLIYSLFLALVFGALVFNFGKKGRKDHYGNVFPVFFGKKGTIIAATIVFVAFGLINYFSLPTLAFWGFEGVWLELLMVTLVAPIVHMVANEEFEWKRFIPAGVVALIFFAGLIGSSAMFHAQEYHDMLVVEDFVDDNFNDQQAKSVVDSTFNANIHPISIERMISVDDTLAIKGAEEILSKDLGLGSRVYVGSPTLQCLTGEFTINGGKQLKFGNDLVWVLPLEHKSLFKWQTNKVTPGYILVDATDFNKRHLVTEVNGQNLQLKYLESGYFNDDIERHIRKNGYLSKGLNDHCFEIDGNGRPFWVLSTYIQKVGFFGEESVGAITVDVQTGELHQYSIDEAPSWIDRIQPKDFVEDQIANWGQYADGWLNSWFSEINVLSPTPGTTLVFSEGRSYWYTGIKSAGLASEGTSGFMLVDTRTKAAKFYRISGVNEAEAMRIANEQQFAKAQQYEATFPIIYNVRGNATYFMIMKGQTGNVAGYCFMAVGNRQVIGCSKTKQEAEAAYLRMLKLLQNDQVEDGPVTAQTKELTVRGIVQESNIYYLLFNEVRGVEFTGSTEFFPELKWTKVGDKVKVSYNEGTSKVIPLDTFDNIRVEI